ncbi:hypothetical protein ACIBVL_19545 [Streptomyces sp. NPDC049687]|uniref:hypothetical protein n=1 Tax=Streptomyces sp. NPDC049687 TaxID=3365596 RepID=UPI0037B4F5C6
MASPRFRSVLIAAAAVTGTLLMTACQSDDVAQGNVADVAATANVAAANKGGVSGTFSNGTVDYLAPGKYTVTTGGKTQAFWLAEDTKIWGSGGVCGDADGQAVEECTAAELEKAAKSGPVPADVVMKNGIAVTVTERHPASSGTGGSSTGGSSSGSSSTGGSSSGSSSTGGSSSSSSGGSSSGVSGTWLGAVSYLAPGKYLVSDGRNNPEQQFWLAEDTEILGAGGMCGDADGQSATTCTEAELEAAAKAGKLTAEVTLKDGIATRIAEDH